MRPVSRNCKEKAPRLLILSCSKTKRQAGGKLAALELYNGPAFRSLRKFLNSSTEPGNLDVIILSGRYGFISPHRRIRFYDQRIQPDVGLPAAKLLKQFIKLTDGKFYSEVLINLGLDYMHFLPDLSIALAGNPVISNAEGKIGEKLRAMKAWLYWEKRTLDLQIQAPSEQRAAIQR